MSVYAKFLKELLTKKRKFPEQETIELEAGYSAIIQKSLPKKPRDLGSPCHNWKSDDGEGFVRSSC